MNYSLLLTRSIDFDPFAPVLYPAYPDELTRPLLLSLIQTLWDRGEPNGYAQHMTDDPYPQHPRAHRAAAHGVRRPPGRERRHGGRGADDRREPALPAVDPAATPRVDPYYGIEPIRRYPYHGSALVVWDIGPLRGDLGTPAPPITNTPPELGATRTASPVASGGSGAVLRVHRRRVHRRVPRDPRATPPGGPALRRCAGVWRCCWSPAAGVRCRRAPGCDPIGTGDCLTPGRTTTSAGTATWR